MSFSQLAFALEIIRLLAERPRKREELADLLSQFLKGEEKIPEDMDQKLTRTIRKLRDCGFEIESAPHRPYMLKKSNFPLLMSSEQRQAFYLATHILSQMGFATQASHLKYLCPLSEKDNLLYLNMNFNPPVDYDEENLRKRLDTLLNRLERQCRYSIRYRSSSGSENLWDLDRSELRLHNDVIYLFAYVPDLRTQRIKEYPNVEQNVLFRVDRILNVGASSETKWLRSSFEMVKICYRMQGALAKYQPRRHHEKIINRDLSQDYVEIETIEDCLFWFRQRILQYGANAQVLSPQWLAEDIYKEHEKACQAYNGQQ